MIPKEIAALSLIGAPRNDRGRRLARGNRRVVPGGTPRNDGVKGNGLIQFIDSLSPRVYTKGWVAVDVCKSISGNAG